MKTLIKCLTWIPLLGIGFEIIHARIYHELYMSDDTNPLWSNFTCLYHVITSVFLVLYIASR